MVRGGPPGILLGLSGAFSPAQSAARAIVDVMLLVITFAVKDRGRAVVEEVLDSAAAAVYLTDLVSPARRQALLDADVVLVIDPVKEIRPDEMPLLEGKRLIQFISAGLDWINLDAFPRDVPLASNAGAYAAPMAEHALAMALAAAKRLLVEQRNLAQGQFNQFTPNKMLAGKICGIFGLGGVGMATARLAHCFGMRIHAINRHGTAPEAPAAALDWIGKPGDLDKLLAAADVLVISAPLTPATRGVIGVQELSRMKDDAVLVNLARGEIIDQDALYAHLQDHPRFTACIDAWWTEPLRHGRFALEHPFLELPNVIGSPHNSASVESAREFGLRRAVENCRRALVGETPLHLILEADRLPRM